MGRPKASGESTAGGIFPQVSGAWAGMTCGPGLQTKVPAVALPCGLVSSQHGSF